MPPESTAKPVVLEPDTNPFTPFVPKAEEPHPENQADIFVEGPEEVVADVDLQTGNMAVEEPPESPANETENLPEFSSAELKGWIAEFFSDKKKMISSAFKSVEPRLQGDTIHVSIESGIGLESFTEMRYEFAGFISAKTNGRISGLAIDKNEVLKGDKRPYTDKDKLEYLQKIEPKIAEMVKRLDLRIR